MKQIRYSIFETNSSSTHAITFTEEPWMELLDNEKISLNKCPSITLLNIDKFYPDSIYAIGLADKLSLLLTDGILAHPYQKEECLKAFNELFNYIKIKDNVRLKYDLSLLSDKSFMKEWEEYTDGNGNPVIQYPLNSASDSYNNLDEYFKNRCIDEQKEEIDEKTKSIEHFKMFHQLNSSKFDYHYEEENELEHMKVTLKFMESGHKNSWEYSVYNDPIITNIKHLYQFITDTRFSIHISRD